MVRGPMALFGAIIAVGLGPALWLGAQFGHITVDPAPKAPVIADAPGGNAPGRAGAAVDEAGLDTKLNVVPDKQVNDDAGGRRLVPLSNTPSARPASSPPVVEPERTPSTAPTSSTPSPTRSTTTPPPGPSTPPTESTPALPPSSPAGPVPEVSADTPSTPADTPTTGAGTPTEIVSAPPATPPETQSEGTAA